MSRPRRLAYAYAVGRVRALERTLISEAVFREAAEADDLRSALKLVYDAGAYPEALIKVVDSVDLDGVLEREAERNRGLLEEIMLDSDVLEALRLEGRPELALAFAQRARYSFIVDYFRHKIDLANIKIFFRAKYLGFSGDRLERVWLSGGTIPLPAFREGYPLPWAETRERFGSSAYGELWVRALQALETRETFLVLERGIEDFQMDYLRRAKQITFGPEPVFAYGLAKKREINLVRLLGLGKMLQIPVELLKERISLTYA